MQPGTNPNAVMWTMWGGSQTVPSPSGGPGWRALNSQCPVSPMAIGFPFNSRKGSTAGMGCDIPAERDVSRQAKGAAEEHDAPGARVPNMPDKPALVHLLLFSPASLPRQTENSLQRVPKDDPLMHTSRKQRCSQCAATPGQVRQARNSWDYGRRLGSLLNSSFSP